MVGGGICGVSAALEAERLGASVVLLERQAIASGASGRNAGYLMRGMAESYAAAEHLLGRERARAVWAWSEENLRSLRALGAETTAGFADRPSCLLAFSEEEAAELRDSHRMLREDGFESGLVERGAGDDTLWRRADPLVGLVNPNDAVCQPVELVSMLAGRLRSAEVRTGVEVGRIEPEDGGVALLTSSGPVRARRVLICTNAHAAQLLPGLAGVISPRRGQMLAARASGVDLRYAYYLNRGDEYLRLGPGGELLMGGCRTHERADEAGEHGGVSRVVQDGLEAWLRRLATDDFEVSHRWSGTMGFSENGLPVVGPMAEDERVWVCAGFTGHGMSLGHLTATHAVRAMLVEREAMPAFVTPTPA